MKNRMFAAAFLLALLTGCGQTYSSSETDAYRKSKETPPVPVTETTETVSESITSTTVVVTETAATNEQTAETTTYVNETEQATEQDEEIIQTEVITEELTETSESEEQYDTYYGILIDEDCSDFEYPPLHDLPCMLMDSCRESGYGLDIEQDDGTWIFYMFDENGQTLSWEYLINTEQMDGLYVTVTGIWEDDLIKVINLY